MNLLVGGDHIRAELLHAFIGGPPVGEEAQCDLGLAHLGGFLEKHLGVRLGSGLAPCAMPGVTATAATMARLDV